MTGPAWMPGLLAAFLLVSAKASVADVVFGLMVGFSIALRARDLARHGVGFAMFVHATGMVVVGVACLDFLGAAPTGSHRAAPQSSALSQPAAAPRIGGHTPAPPVPSKPAVTSYVATLVLALAGAEFTAVILLGRVILARLRDDEDEPPRRSRKRLVAPVERPRLAWTPSQVASPASIQAAVARPRSRPAAGLRIAGARVMHVPAVGLRAAG